MKPTFSPLPILAVAALAVPLVTATATADDEAGAEEILALTPEEATAADPDFAKQGEYAGSVAFDGGEFELGIQVVALGGGKFDVVVYAGGLPGAGWDGERRWPHVAETSDKGVTSYEIEAIDSVGFIRDGRIDIVDGENFETTSSFEKVERKSPTLGEEPPEGAVVLFDGSSADAFDPGRMTEDGLLMENATSKQKFGSHRLHVEFRTPYKPAARGQDRGNSGLYMQGRYETQILDSFGLTGEMNECGGVYSIARPAVNACLPPLSWQTYDVDFTAAEYDADGNKTANGKMTVHLNGIKVHEDLDLTHATTAAPLGEGPDPGPVYLQGHGNPVRFKNIWVVEK